MAQLRIAMAQVNPRVGDLAGNSAIILSNIAKAHNAGADLVLFPEMVLTGYPIEDLALRATFRSASRQALKNLADESERLGFGDLLSVVGYLDSTQDQRPQNAVAVIHRGEVIATYIKQDLPNYGVFDEYRNFVAGNRNLQFRFKGVDISLAICEDIWSPEGPILGIAHSQPGLLIVPNGSPFEKSKDDVRLNLVKERAAQIGAPVAYLNLVGGQDELLFDGDSLIVDHNKQLLARSPQFEEGVMIVDLELKARSGTPDIVVSEEEKPSYTPISTPISHRLEPLAQVWQALTLSLRDYILKNNFSTVALGVSGGIDSAVVAAIAVDALGRDRVFTYALPSKYSSEHSLSDAVDLAKRLGVSFSIIPIEKMVSAFVSELELSGLSEENVQARVRGTTLMAISNKENHLILATGNKSELAVGYSTLYGDAVGAFAPIKDIFKMEVWALARWRNAQAVAGGEIEPIPVNSIEKEPSAELRPGQKDSDSLPEYAQLDYALNIYVDEDKGLAGMIAAGVDRDFALRVVSLVDKAEYKRRQYPPGTKISAKAFGKDRRLPITSSWRE
jgi:NAD+ synthase (glutamine-hydrolysing)